MASLRRLAHLRHAALLASLAFACGGEEPETLDVSLAFEALVGDQAARCGVTFTGLGVTGAEAQLADARLFVSEVELQDAAGAWVPLELEQDGQWQVGDVALLDFEDKTGACADSGTPEVNAAVRGKLPAGEYRGVRFTLGVPFAQNHNDSAAAPAPLNTPGMFWVWQSGYKFLRVDWTVSGGAVPRWNVHLGSTQCQSEARTDPPAVCDRSNRARGLIEGFDPATDRVAIDLAALVAGADLAANQPETAPGCMSGPNEPEDCGPVFGALGMSFESGGCVGECAAQRVFSRM